ncbi:MAG: DUF1631 family protein [Thiobacillus sp.]
MMPALISSDTTLLLMEADERMEQALSQFFQRHAANIEVEILREMPRMMSPSGISTVQTCLDWLKFKPETLSTAFSIAFRTQLNVGRRPEASPITMQLMDDTVLDRQIAVSHCINQLHDPLFEELSAVVQRMNSLHGAPLEKAAESTYSPQCIVRSLSNALDTLEWEGHTGSFFLRHCVRGLTDTLRQTYVALDGFLITHNVPLAAKTALPDAVDDVNVIDADGQIVLDFLKQDKPPHHISNDALVSYADSMGGTGTQTVEHLALRTLAASWQGTHSGLSTPDISQSVPQVVLRDHYQEAQSNTHISPFDLRVLHAVAQLFEALLGEFAVASGYLEKIAQLQIPVLRVALSSPTFFSDETHPARRLIDLLGTCSRNFPENSPRYDHALSAVEQACSKVLSDPDHHSDIFAASYDELASWVDNETQLTDARLSDYKAELAAAEQHELGTLLALETLGDLTERYPAPEAVLRQLETAWVPHMVKLYVEETGEGPAWREAGRTMLKLFQSMQPPVNVIDRAEKLRSLPEINRALREGLTREGAQPDQLREFFMAITARQECWIRPEMGENAPLTSEFVPLSRSREELEALAQQIEEDDPYLEQADQLREGDWIDFKPPFNGMDSARVAWVGLQGYLLFCDDHGDQRFSTDTPTLSTELRAGRAVIADLALTRKAMLRVREALEASA